MKKNKKIKTKRRRIIRRYRVLYLKKVLLCRCAFLTNPVYTKLKPIKCWNYTTNCQLTFLYNMENKEVARGGTQFWSSLYISLYNMHLHTKVHLLEIYLIQLYTVRSLPASPILPQLHDRTKCYIKRKNCSRLFTLNFTTLKLFRLGEK